MNLYRNSLYSETNQTIFRTNEQNLHILLNDEYIFNDIG